MKKHSKLLFIVLLVSNFAIAHEPSEYGKEQNTLSANNYNQGYNTYNNPYSKFNRTNNLIAEFDKFLNRDFNNTPAIRDKKYFDKKTNSYIAKIFLGINNIDTNNVNVNVSNKYITINVNTNTKYQSDNINSYQSNYAYNSFSIPSDANTSKLTKRYDKKTGVLTIVIPKK